MKTNNPTRCCDYPWPGSPPEVYHEGGEYFDSPGAVMGAFRRDWFGTACEVLREVGLYEVPADDVFESTYRTPTVKTLYRFGEAWLYWEIPADVIARIKGWANWGQRG